MSVRIFWVADIPTPYRNHRYERMAALFPGLGLEFEVQFMAWTDPLRPWSFRPDELRYPHRVHAGVNLHWLSPSFHVNPGLLWRLARERRDVLVVGGWSSPTAVLAPFAVSSGTLRLLESESHLGSSRYVTGPAKRLKGAVIRRYDGYIGPGRRARDLTATLAPSTAGRPFIEFPNLIDKTVFGDGVERARAEAAETRAALGVSDRTQLWLCPARLETFKGVHLLPPVLEGLEGIHLLMCGDGSLRPRLQEMIDTKRLPVRLAGQKSEAEMVRLYAAADLFVLTSIADASPLAAIEACAAGLPILASRRIGNFEDVVVEGENGWGFDTDRPESNRPLLERIAALPREELRRMGRRSRELYDRRFDSDLCVRRLGEGIRDLHARHAREG